MSTQQPLRFFTQIDGEQTELMVDRSNPGYVVSPIVPVEESDASDSDDSSSGSSGKSGGNGAKVTTLDGEELEWSALGHGRVRLVWRGRVFIARVAHSAQNEYALEIDGRHLIVRVDDEVSHRAHHAAGGGAASGTAQIASPMPGTVVKILVEEGESVAKDQPVVIVEAMKMQNELASPVAGVVQNVSAQPGQAVDARQLICEIVP